MKKFKILIFLLIISAMLMIPTKVAAETGWFTVKTTNKSVVGGYVSVALSREILMGESVFLEYDPTVLEYIPEENPEYNYQDLNGRLTITASEQESIDEAGIPFVEFKVLSTNEKTTEIKIGDDGELNGMVRKISIGGIIDNENVNCPKCEFNNYVYLSIGLNVVLLLGCIYFIVTKKH